MLPPGRRLQKTLSYLVVTLWKFQLVFCTTIVAHMHTQKEIHRILLMKTRRKPMAVT